MARETSAKDIFSNTYKDNNHYHDKLFEQYKIYIKNIDSLENRRKTTHGFFLSINVGLISLLGILVRFGITSESNEQLLFILLSIMGIVFAYSWLRTTMSYILLSTVKWEIIIEIEKVLPLQIHDTEWKILRSKKGRSKYLKLTDVELVIPIIFIILYILSIIINSIIYSNYASFI